MKVTVIMPVYNAVKTIRNSVHSVLNQTLTDFELLLIDDGSVDESGIVCDELQTTDNRIRVIHQKNQGQAVARNTAIDIAQGDYIAFVDSDDYVHPVMLEVLYNNAVITNAQISVGGTKSVKEFNQFDDVVSEACTPQLWRGDEFLRHCFADNVEKKQWVLWDKLYSRSCFKNIRLPKGRIHEDNAVVYQLLYEAEFVADCTAPLYYYYYNPQSTFNSSFSLKKMDWLLVPQEMIAYFEKAGDRAMYDKANQLYLSALIDMYNEVKKNLNNTSVEKKLKCDMKKQYRHERRVHSISIETDPEVYEILFPLKSFFYWTYKGLLNKFRRELCQYRK